MKSSFFLLLIVCCILQSCTTPERNCTDFKTGTFAFETLIEGQLVSNNFTRNDTLEILFINGKADSSSVRWINDCEYIEKKINPKSRSEEKALHFKIISTDKDFYTFEYSFVGKTIKKRGTAQKIKN